MQASRVVLKWQEHAFKDLKDRVIICAEIKDHAKEMPINLI